MPHIVQPLKSHELGRSARPAHLEFAAMMRQRLAFHHNKLHMNEGCLGVLQGTGLQMSGICRGRLETVIWVSALRCHAADRSSVMSLSCNEHGPRYLINHCSMTAVSCLQSLPGTLQSLSSDRCVCLCKPWLGRL